MRPASVFVALGRSADVAREHRIGGWLRRPAGGARKGRTGATPPWGGWFSAPVGEFAYSAWHHSLTRSTLRVLLRRGDTSRARKPPAASRRKQAAAATRGRSTADRQPDNRMPGWRCRRPSIALLAVPGRLASPCPLQRHHRPRTRPPRPNSSRMRNLFFLPQSRARQPIQTRTLARDTSLPLPDSMPGVGASQGAHPAGRTPPHRRPARWPIGRPTLT